jgi:hypothetical protein
MRISVLLFLCAFICVGSYADVDLGALLNVLP